MSKTLRTLEEIRDQRKNKYTFMVHNAHAVPPEPAPSSLSAPHTVHAEAAKLGPSRSNERLFIILLVVASVLFAIINGRMLVELSKMRVTTSAIAKGMGNYEIKLKQFEKGLEKTNTNYVDMKDSVDHQVQSLQADNKRIIDKLDDVGLQSDLLRVQMKELEATNQKLMEGYIGLNNEIKELQSSISSVGTETAQ